MISKNLKVGETFEDGGRMFEVIEIVPEGYISRVVEKKTVEEETVKPKKKTVKKD